MRKRPAVLPALQQNDWVARKQFLDLSERRQTYVAFDVAGHIPRLWEIMENYRTIIDSVELGKKGIPGGSRS